MSSLFSRLASLAGVLASLWLIVFHISLFWRRLADASIANPAVLARWIAAVVLLAGFAAFQRYVGQHRRQATIVFWLLVAMLHLSMPAEERLLDLDAQLAILVQVGFVAMPAALLVIALLGASNVACDGALGLVSRSSSSPRNPEPATRPRPRSPPQF